MKLRYAVLAAAAFATGASAQNLKPGLWEVTNKMGGSGDMGAAMAQMQKEMANMTPEQRKQMQAMMAKHGVQMAPGKGGGMTSRMCMSREMAERNEIPAQHGDCRMTNQQKSGNTVKFAMKCTNPPASGEGQVTISSPEAYTMKMNMKTTVDGKPHAMTMDAAGKWVGADCGSLKPIQPPKK